MIAVSLEMSDEPKIIHDRQISSIKKHGLCHKYPQTINAAGFITDTADCEDDGAGYKADGVE